MAPRAQKGKCRGEEEQRNSQGHAGGGGQRGRGTPPHIGTIHGPPGAPLDLRQPRPPGWAAARAASRPLPASPAPPALPLGCLHLLEAGGHQRGLPGRQHGHRRVPAGLRLLGAHGGATAATAAAAAPAAPRVAPETAAAGAACLKGSAGPGRGGRGKAGGAGAAQAGDGT